MSHTFRPLRLFAANSPVRWVCKNTKKHIYKSLSVWVIKHTCTTNRTSLLWRGSIERVPCLMTAGPQSAGGLPAASSTSRRTCCLLPHCSVSRIGSPAITSVLWFPPSSPSCKMSSPAPTLLFRIIFFPLRHSASPSSTSLLCADCLYNVVKMSWAVALWQIALYWAAAGLCVVYHREAGQGLRIVWGWGGAMTELPNGFSYYFFFFYSSETTVA